MSKRLWFVVAIVFSLVLVLGACGSNDNDNNNNNDNNENTGAENNDNNNDNNNNNNNNDNNDEEASGDSEDGTLTYAIDNEPDGIFVDGFTSSAVDAQIIDFVHESLFDVDEELHYSGNLVEWETDDNQHYTFTLEEGVKWHDGEELTMEDWQFALEVLAHEDYEGNRYNYVEGIEGAEEYHEGEADEISGFELIGDYEAEITFTAPRVNNIENLWSSPLPKHYLEDIEVADMEEAEEIRDNPIGLGPFKIKEINPGEYVSLERFDDYWQGKPKLSEILVKVIDTSQISGALESEEVDIMEIRPDDIEQLEALDNVEVIEHEGLGYSYIGFRFGHRVDGESVPDFDKYEDKRVRQAMFYAIDRESIIDAYLTGAATIVNSPVPSTHWIRADESELTQYDYDPEKAEELLDEAGYTIKDGDEFRTDPDGNEFVIKFSHYAGGDPFQGRTEAIIQNWEDVGLEVELATGQLIEFNQYNEMKENDDPNIEVFFGAWSTGADPDPSGLWASDAEFNFGRWVNEESDELLADALGEDAFDEDYRADLYVEWQKLYNEELPGLPLWENVDLYGINNKVKGYTIQVTGLKDFHEWYIEED